MASDLNVLIILGKQKERSQVCINAMKKVQHILCVSRNHLIFQAVLYGL